MPGGDKTGPAGQGSRTGRGKGLCSGNKQPGSTDNGNRRGMGRRLGQGRGRGTKG
jgi:hypothetical protein